MFLIFRNVVQGAEQSVNIIPTIGVEMFVYMWIATGTAIGGWLVVFAGCCCCASRRDIKLGRKRGRSEAWIRSGEVPPVEIREREEREKKERKIKEKEEQNGTSGVGGLFRGRRKN